MCGEEAVPLSRVPEKILIETALKHTGGRKGEAAELLGWGRNTRSLEGRVSSRRCCRHWPTGSETAVSGRGLYRHCGARMGASRRDSP
ncbi:helix-turn-helix domain-containing protein [Halomonas alkalisoli]|uniref:helix-turn-helix domain-containing protein n=1 Tax=Halomonas alkalisoli TaxID=2907158 RepID=UPI0034E1AC60